VKPKRQGPKQNICQVFKHKAADVSLKKIVEKIPVNEKNRKAPRFFKSSDGQIFALQKRTE
jgi:hypothetical protein